MRKRTKFLLLRVSIILTFSLLAGRIWYVQVVMGSYYKQQADTSKIRLEPVQALRGILYDRRGVPLVFNAPSWNVYVVPHGVPDSSAWQIYRRLSSLLHGKPSPQQLYQDVQNNQWRAYLPVAVKQNVGTQTALMIKQLHLQLPGVRAEPSSARQYTLDPQMSLAHVLGYTGEINPTTYAYYSKGYPGEHYQENDNVGADGVEYEMEPFLHGVNGTQQVMVDAGERPVKVLQQARTVPGDDVYLTIDSALQAKVSNDLATGLARLGMQKGVAIVENVRNGQILAMASLPGFDNNLFSHPLGTAQYRKLALLNLATQGEYPPGSTYKIITAAAALQTGVVNADTTVYDGGEIDLKCPGTNQTCQIFHGWQPRGLGDENVVSALAQSSDIYFYTVAGGNPNTGFAPYVGADRLAGYAREFGLGAPTGIDLPGEHAGLVPSKSWFDSLKPAPLVKNPGDSWHIGNTYNMAIGQGQNQVTPLQMVNAMSAVANGGTLFRPRVVMRIKGRVQPHVGTYARPRLIQPFVPSIIRKNFIDPGNLALIQEGLHDGVAWTNWKGTSWLVHDDRIDAAGKTGTAEAPGGSHAWWIGYAPYTNPEIAVLVMVPNAVAEGSYAAAPIAHKIFEDYFHLPPQGVPGEPVWPNDVRKQLLPGWGGTQ